MNIRHNNSIKRQAIIDALCASHEHPSAEMIYDKLKNEYPQLSLGTVYRNLSYFVDEGLAVAVANVDGHIRYDGITKSHPHFICSRCRRVLDIKIDVDTVSLCDSLEMAYGITAESCSLSFSGVCPDCGT